MKRRRWVVTCEKPEPFSNDVFAVDVRREGQDDYESTTVWYDRSDDTASCVNCSGPLVAMSRSCRHVAAALRAIRTGKVDGIKPL